MASTKFDNFDFSIAAFAAISIQATDNVIKYGKTDIDILWFLNGTSLKSTDGIQLKKFNTNIVSVSQHGIYWQDKNLQTRSKINATIEIVNPSYLHLKIFACIVERTDEATYFCDISATTADFSVYKQSSDEIFMNITGKTFIFVKLYMPHLTLFLQCWKTVKPDKNIGNNWLQISPRRGITLIWPRYLII